MYWNYFCPIGAIEGLCETRPQFQSVQCPVSCETAECASQVPTVPADVASLKEALADMLTQNPATTTQFDWEPKFNQDPCSSHWAAVRCDHSAPRRYVTTFHVHRKKLGIYFPSALLRLSRLEILGFISVDLGGELPNQMGRNLPLLKYISFANNRLSGSLPASLSLLKHLEYADFRQNNFHGHILKNVAASLQNLDMSFNRLSGTLMSDINVTG